MKRIKSLLIFMLVFSLLLTGCRVNTKNIEINIGDSQIFNEEELMSAVDVIIDEISSWEGIKIVYTIDYCGDAYANEDNLAYCDELGNEKSYTKCALFEVSFKTARHHTGGFNENEIYTDWQFYLARTDDGGWDILTWGYC